MNKALVILSGGQDSTTCLFWAVKHFGIENVEAVGFDYNQRHRIELNFANDICKKNGVPYKIIKTPLISELTSNSLTRSEIDVDIKVSGNSLPNSFVEGRNLLFLTYAAIYAKNKNIKHLVTGVCETDFSGYPDCRDIFIKSANVTLNLAMDYEFVVDTPLMWLNKAQIWELANDLGILDIIYNNTVTCYNGVASEGCGECPACTLRKRGYAEFIKKRGEGDV